MGEAIDAEPLPQKDVEVLLNAINNGKVPLFITHTVFDELHGRSTVPRKREYCEQPRIDELLEKLEIIDISEIATRMPDTFRLDGSQQLVAKGDEKLEKMLYDIRNCKRKAKPKRGETKQEAKEHLKWNNYKDALIAEAAINHHCYVVINDGTNPKKKGLHSIVNYYYPGRALSYDEFIETVNGI